MENIAPCNSWDDLFLSSLACWNGAGSRFAPRQWETPLQSNTVSHWLGANLESVLLNVAGQNCKVTRRAATYLGNLAHAADDKPCLAWANMAKEHYVFPDGSPEEANDFCRNPIWDPFGPWCFTSVEPLDWAYCNIEYCGENYCGHLYICWMNVTWLFY